MDDTLQFAEKKKRRELTTGKVAWPAPKGPSTQHSSDRYLRLKWKRLFLSDDIKKPRSSRSRLHCEVQKSDINTRHMKAQGTGLTSPQLAAHFAEEEANGQQGEGGWSAENTSPVVMQILPHTTGKSLRETKCLLFY